MFFLKRPLALHLLKQTCKRSKTHTNKTDVIFLDLNSRVTTTTTTLRQRYTKRQCFYLGIYVKWLFPPSPALPPRCMAAFVQVCVAIIKHVVKMVLVLPAGAAVEDFQNIIENYECWNRLKRVWENTLDGRGLPRMVAATAVVVTPPSIPCQSPSCFVNWLIATCFLLWRLF